MSPRGAVLLDALGTLLELSPPAPILTRLLEERLGVRVEPSVAERAMAAEIAYYRAHNLEGRDGPSLADLRLRCTEVLRDALGERATALADGELGRVLLDSLRFVPFADARPALKRLRQARLALVVVSNWDCSLHDVLADSGLAPLVDAAVTSAEVGAAKPAPAVFVRGLELAGVAADRAVHVGDSLGEDVQGARAAGIRPVLLVRGAVPPRPPGVPVIGSLAEAPEIAP